MNRRFMFLQLCFVCSSVFSYAQYNEKVQAALKQTRTNQNELKKALNHFYKSGDSLKIRSINFLIENMPIHSTYSYYWADSNGNRIKYNELDYPTFNDAVNAFDQLKNKYGKLHPVSFVARDIDVIKAEYLIANVEHSCKTWRARSGSEQRAGIGEEEFLEYVLPHRVDVEAISEWKDIYNSKFNNVFRNNFFEDSIRLREYINTNFKNLYNIERRIEPLPRLNALQILLRGKGYCEDMADMAVFAARSQGIPATIDNIPAWATSTGQHSTNYLYFNRKHRFFDSALDSIAREPGKVVRTTYSKQPGAIASWLDTTEIPNGFLRLQNYKDVTNEYWQTCDFTIDLFPNAFAKAVFVGVFNAGNVVPIWFAKKNGSSATFKNMSKGVVYFPFYYEKGSAKFAAYPFANGYNNKAVLKPNFKSLHRIILKEEEKYLKYRQGKRYQLLMWENGWKLLAEQIASNGCIQLTFENVPENALLLLRPEYSQGKERPFTILKDGQRIWW